MTITLQIQDLPTSLMTHIIAHEIKYPWCCNIVTLHFTDCCYKTYHNYCNYIHTPMITNDPCHTQATAMISGRNSKESPPRRRQDMHIMCHVRSLHVVYACSSLYMPAVRVSVGSQSIKHFWGLGSLLHMSKHCSPTDDALLWDNANFPNGCNT